jgi:hypothetical protein
VLDWVAFNDGRAARFPPELSRSVLRRVIAEGLVTIVGQGPSIYRLTGIGRMVRWR